MKKRIAIIGAGFGALTLANRLHPKAAVTLFEKARGLGGRMSTRQAEAPPAQTIRLFSSVVQTENSWAQEHVNDDQGKTSVFLRQELGSILETDLKKAAYFSLHRWRYAILKKAHDDESREIPFFDSDMQLASTGDWCARSRIEDVWLEANRLAEQILDRVL